MNTMVRSGFLSAAMLMALPGTSSAQGIHPNQTRADAELNRQRAESVAIQKKNEQTDKDDRAQFEARKKAYEKDERRKEDQLRRDALVQERALQPQNRK